MSKKLGGGSWLTAVKRAFRSPSKEEDKKASRRRLETHEQDIDDEKKKEKRRWLFRRASSNNNIKQQQPIQCEEMVSIITKSDQQRHAIAVAAATTAAAEAAVATANAAAEIIRLTKPTLKMPLPPLKTPLKEHHAAIIVQTAFRGYLARRALQALRGIVKLQAMVRGHNVRKQTKATLKYIHALRHVQTRNARPSQEATRNSMFAESTNLWDSRYMKDVRTRKSTSRGGSWIPEEWEDCPRTLQELDALLQARKNASLTRERSLAHAFSQQIWNYEKEPYAGNDKNELDGGDNCLSEWMETKTKQCDTNKRRSSYDRRESIKTLEVDSSKKTYCYSSPLISKGFSPSPQAPFTPSPVKMKPLHVRPSSPHAQREARASYSTANTPCLAMPNYMAATESAKAKVRSQSATRQRPSTPERERGGGGVRKRLSYPVVHDMYCGYGVGCHGCGQKLRSTSFKSVQAGYVGMEQGSNISSCCADSVVGGEISPCSTTDLRRWLR